jgi:hypothetical protein
MFPIALTDEQLDAIMRACQPLQPADRGPFLEAVAAALQGRVIGDGTVYLAIAAAQRQHRDPPVAAGGGGGGGRRRASPGAR